MTDSQLIFGIKQNDERAWRYICRELRYGFIAILRRKFSSYSLGAEDIDDLFQESLVILMQRVKAGSVVATRHDGGIFSYIVEIGTLLTQNFLRKKRPIASDAAVTISLSRHNEEEATMSTEERQQQQDEFLDNVFSLLPSECAQLLKYFYWERKPMDKIASLLGMRNADSAKTKKSKCMNKFKDIAAQLVESDELAEEAVRSAVERAALRELIRAEIAEADTYDRTAALDINDDSEEDR